MSHTQQVDTFNVQLSIEIIGQKKEFLQSLKKRAQCISLNTTLTKLFIPRVWGHHAATAVSHPAIVRKAPSLGSCPAVPLLPGALVPAMAFHHHLSARAEMLEREPQERRVNVHNKARRLPLHFHRSQEGNVHASAPPCGGGVVSSEALTWSPITMGLPPSRPVKLDLPRLAEEPPLRAGPGPSLPERSGRIRTAPLQDTTTGRQGYSQSM